MWTQVNEYFLNWQNDEGRYTVQLVLDTEVQAEIQLKSLEELDAFGNILRNEKPVFYETNLRVISTGPEPVGENE